jgi:hypothetical protein
MPKSDADRLAETVKEIVKHGHDDLPEGPASPLGGEARPNALKTRSLSEVKRLANLGKALVDKQIASRDSVG